MTVLTAESARTVRIPLRHGELIGDLSTPEQPAGLVLFAHGSGSSRLSPRNRMVAAELVRHGLATLLFDLLTEAESRERANVFDIDLLASRLVAATDWIADEPRMGGVPLGYFGASTGAAAALVAAAQLGNRIRAVVSRGGRPDLAGGYLGGVTAPVLLIVGGADEPVIGLNRMAAERLRAPHKVVIIPGASHLFEEPGTLERAAQVAAEWFERYLPVED